MFCENCGKEIPDDVKFCPICGHKTRDAIKTSYSQSKEKNMVLALIISFILPGLGIVYAGNAKKGILIFVGGLIFSILGIGIPVCKVIGLIIWIYGLYETYNEMKRVEGVGKPNLLEDWKSWDNPKKIGGAIVALFILLIFVGGIISAFSPTTTVDDHSSLDSDSIDTSDSLSGSSSSSDTHSSSSDSYSSSSNGHDSYSHYEGEYGSADTHGTVYDDGSVEAHQKGHTDYGDYKIDSYMDSNGNLHGTVDVGGRTYHVSN